MTSHESGSPLTRLTAAVERATGMRVASEQLLGSSPRSVVARLVLTSPAATEEVIAKHVRAATEVNQPSGAVESPLLPAVDRERDADERFAVELAAYRRLAASRSVPGLVAVDAGERVLVLEYVAGVDIIPLLLGTESGPARSALVAFAETLADIHGAGMTPTTRPTDDELATVDRARAASALRGASVLGDVTGCGGQWRSELDAVLRRLGMPGPLTTWLHGDPCPGNVVIQDDRAVMVDLESSLPGNAALEAAFLRMAFPTCWCVGGIDDNALAAAESAYRARLAPVCAGVADDLSWLTALADACCYWAVEGNALVQRAERGTDDLIRRALDDDWHWGTFTARQRLHRRLDQAARLATELGDRPHLVRLLTAAADLDALPGETPNYPALQRP